MFDITSISNPRFTLAALTTIVVVNGLSNPRNYLSYLTTLVSLVPVFTPVALTWIFDFMDYQI